MRILDRSIYVGPSHFARFPVIRLELDLGELEAWPTGKLGPAFVNGLVEALPGRDHDDYPAGEEPPWRWTVRGIPLGWSS